MRKSVVYDFDNMSPIRRTLAIGAVKENLQWARYNLKTERVVMPWERERITVEFLYPEDLIVLKLKGILT